MKLSILTLAAAVPALAAAVPTSVDTAEGISPILSKIEAV
ncbi:hypothetical protein FOMA001_g7387 [Fusarium oxysporum f. sp. matthiolae]|nr:hypothetical protein FOMA001_g7387 [Fusarium oxysporum f. sp. matthiolae]